MTTKITCDRDTGSTKALFLDRDGVINTNHGYVYQPNNFDFIDGIFDLCFHAQKQGYRIIIVTNQSGIARKYYSETQFKQLSRWLSHQFWIRNIVITQTLHCPHHPKFSHTCSCRKPRTGMIVRAQKRFKIDLSQSVMVGDSLSDMQCALTAGIKKAVLLKPNSLQYLPDIIQPIRKPFYLARNLKSIRTLL